MRAFIVGATGYIGSHVLRRLLAADHDGTGFARNERGRAVTIFSAQLRRRSSALARPATLHVEGALGIYAFAIERGVSGPLRV
jgi:nucleoside-diphosphate-sugar epimerase